jgi:hypothetical protein
LLFGSQGGHVGSEGGHFLVSMGSCGVQKGDDIIVAGKLQLLCLQPLSGFCGEIGDSLPDVLRKTLGSMGGMG